MKRIRWLYRHRDVFAYCLPLIHFWMLRDRSCGLIPQENASMWSINWSLYFSWVHNHHFLLVSDFQRCCRGYSSACRALSRWVRYSISKGKCIFCRLTDIERIKSCSFHLISGNRYLTTLEEVSTWWQSLLLSYPTVPFRLYFQGYTLASEFLDCIDFYLQRHTKNNWISFTTEDLASLDQRHSDAKSEICLMSARILEGLVDALRQFIPVFLAISDCISLLDCLRSFAQHISSSALDSYHRPIFNRSGTLAIKEGRHPLRYSWI